MPQDDRNWNQGTTADRRIRLLAWAAVLAMLVTVLGPSAATNVEAQERSLARGHAQVIAQGVAPMPEVPVAWRVVSSLARPSREAPVAERSLGFVVPMDRPVVITDDRSGQQLRLAAGEASFVPQSTLQRRRSTDDNSAGYYAVELVVAPDLRAGYSLGDASFLYGSAPFNPPRGRRDLNLVRDVIVPGETSRLVDPGAPTLIFITAGMARIETNDGATVTLGAGEATTISGTASITVIGNAVTRYVAAMIGAEVAPPVRAPVPPTVAPPPPPTATPRPPTTVGFIELTPFACPAGMRPETFDASACTRSLDIAALNLFTLNSGENFRTLSDATIEGGTYVWTGLPFGEYLLRATALAAGYDRYLIPGLDGFDLRPDLGYTPGPNDGYVGSLTAARPILSLNFYAFSVIPPATGVADVTVFGADCRRGVVATDDLFAAGCAGVDLIGAGLEVRLTSPALAGPLTLIDALPNGGGGLIWTDLPPGTYTVIVTSLPPRYSGYALRTMDTGIDLTLRTDPAGYTFRLAGDGRFVELDLFTLRS